MSIATGGSDSGAQQITAFLVPANFTIPATLDAVNLDPTVLALAPNLREDAMRSTVAIAGRVTDTDSRPISGAAVNLNGASTTSLSGQYSCVNDVYAFDNTDFLVDINGYFARDDGQRGWYYFPTTQCRLSDTSSTAYTGAFGGPVFADETTRTIRVPLTTRCGGIPASAQADALNVTALPGGSQMPFLTAFPTGQPQPNASILNAFQGQTVTNSAIIPSGTDGSVDVHAFRRTHVVVEISGYFAR